MVKISKFPRYSCQSCGCKRKFVETIIDDEFMWDIEEQMYVPVGFTNEFEHTGFERCAGCNLLWSGA